MIGVAIIGTGAYARVHGRVLRGDPRVELKWVWSRKRENRERFAGEFGLKAVDDWRRCIEDPKVDAVHVVTPDFAHTEYVIAALAAGKHVLVEKPMATSVTECRDILRARDESGKKLMVNYHNRWYPAFVTARESVASGEIGAPVSATFVLSDTITWTETSMAWADKSGPDWFLMSHTADLACWILDDEPATVYAMAHEGVLKSKGVDTRDVVRAIVRMRKGAIVSFESSWILARSWRNPVNEMWLSVHGETGRVDANADFENVVIVTDRFRTPFTLLPLTEDPPIRDFISCLAEDKPVPVTGEDGLLATRFVDAIARSYTEDRVVRVDIIE